MPASDGELIVRRGATAFNEMAMLEQDGRLGLELVDTDMLRLYLRKTGRRWEYKRVAGLFSDNLRRQMERDGWTWVSIWYPFLYFKRDAGPL